MMSVLSELKCKQEIKKILGLNAVILHHGGFNSIALNY